MMERLTIHDVGRMTVRGDRRGCRNGKAVGDDLLRSVPAVLVDGPGDDLFMVICDLSAMWILLYLALGYHR